MSSTRCGKQHPERPSVQCDRIYGHGGVHWNGPGHAIQWGGRQALRDIERAKPLPAGKQLAPHRAPAAPGYAKFKDTPGQGMLSLDDKDPERIDYEAK